MYSVDNSPKYSYFDKIQVLRHYICYIEYIPRVKFMFTCMKEQGEGLLSPFLMVKRRGNIVGNVRNCIRIIERPAPAIDVLNCTIYYS